MDPAADSNQPMVPQCCPSQRSSWPARDPGFATHSVGVTTPNGLAWTWKPITCRCKTIIQAAFGLCGMVQAEVTAPGRQDRCWVAILDQ